MPKDVTAVLEESGELGQLSGFAQCCVGLKEPGLHPSPGCAG